MIIVGLTGGMGSGKTTVAKMFGELGVPVYNSDKEAKRLMNSSKKVIKAIIELLGEKSYKDKKLNKKYVSDRVFGNSELLQSLNDIVHPAVKKHFYAWAKKQQGPYVIQEAAVLFENGSYKKYDKIILVKAPKHCRVKRIQKRDGSSEKEILARMSHQWTDAEKSKLSDFVIENIDLEKTKSIVHLIHAQLAQTSG